MCNYLGAHPNIFMSDPKEPCFFSDDFPGQRYVASMEEYMELFQPASSEHLAAGEGSVWYLYSRNAIQNIHRFNSNAKIIAMLRNPVDLVYSLYGELYHLRYEVEDSFERAWRLQDKRREGEYIPRYCRDGNFLQYARIGKLGEQVERVLNVFPERQIKFIIFDDFISDTARVYTDVLEFLEIPPDNRSEFKPVLQSRRHRLHWVGAFFENQPPVLYRMKMKFKDFIGTDNLGILSLVRRLNTVTEKRKPLPEKFREELKSEFRSDVDKLSSIVQRDLNHWCS